jgi:hypothetical protein
VVRFAIAAKGHSGTLTRARGVPPGGSAETERPVFRTSAFAEKWAASAAKVNLPGAVSTKTTALLGGVRR